MIRLDTNYILRYLVNDNETMADIAEEIINNKNIYISNEVLAEVIYVLFGVYKASKEKIFLDLSELVSFENIYISNKTVVKKALELYKDKNLDFVDCLLCSYSEIDKVLTFDKKLQKCIDS